MRVQRYRVAVPHSEFLWHAVAIARGDFGGARRELDRLSGVARTRRERLDVGLAGLSLATARDEPLDDLAAAVYDIASPAGFILPIAESGSAVLDAVRRTARMRPTSAYVEALMTARPCPPPPSAAATHAIFDSLSERERTILRYLDTSMTYHEIATALFVSVNTIKTHARNITRKLQAGSRTEALARARQLHYL